MGELIGDDVLGDLRADDRDGTKISRARNGHERKCTKKRDFCTISKSARRYPTLTLTKC